MNEDPVKEQDILNCLVGVRAGINFYLREIEEHNHNFFCFLFYFSQDCWKMAQNKRRFEAALEGVGRAHEATWNGDYQPTLPLIREVAALLEEVGLRKTFEEVLFLDMLDLEERLTKQNGGS